MFRILMAMIIGGGALVYVGVQEMRLAAATKPQPQEISCQQLIGSGPGDNANIVLKDFLMLDHAFVYETGKYGKDWKTVWVPAVPMGGAYHRQVLSMVKPDGTLDGTPPTPTDLRVIIKSKKVRGESELVALAEKETMQGLVVNKIESLGSKEKKMLADSYPGVDFENCWIVEHARTPSGSGKSFGMMGGGAGLSLLGLLGAFKSRKSA